MHRSNKPFLAACYQKFPCEAVVYYEGQINKLVLEMYAETLEKDLEKQLSCSICLDTYANPKQLQCNHNLLPTMSGQTVGVE